VPVQWSHEDHPENIPDGHYAMVVNPLIQGYEFSKCLMDGGSSLNIMYMETLTKLGLTKLIGSDLLIIIQTWSTHWIRKATIIA
jgi:hypothetical protein